MSGISKTASKHGGVKAAGGVSSNRGESVAVALSKSKRADSQAKRRCAPSAASAEAPADSAPAATASGAAADGASDERCTLASLSVYVTRECVDGDGGGWDGCGWARGRGRVG